MTVKNVYDAINKIAPFSLTDNFDNTGIIVENLNREVKKILVCLDITKKVALEAVEKKADVVVSHHPVIFNPIKKLCDDHPACILYKNGISAVCAHTNLDMAKGGISDIMAELLGLENSGKVFEVKTRKPYFQVSVFVPNENVDEVYNAMKNKGAGKYENYEGCGFSCNGEGTFIPLDGANPYIGNVGKAEKVNETRLEMLVSPSNLYEVLSAMKKAHPYETPAYVVSENKALFEEVGYGKICKTKFEMTAKELANLVKEKYGCTCVRYTDSGKKINTVAVCSGAGGSNTNLALSMGVDAYITGDVKHDQFIDAENYGLTLIDGGHFHTEDIVSPYLKKILEEALEGVEVTIAENGKDIVNYEI